MTLGLGLGFTKGGAAFPSSFVVAGSPRSLLGYDSNAHYERGEAAQVNGYRDAIEAVFGAESGTQNFAISGCYLLKSTRVAASGVYSLINDDDVDSANWTRDTQYSTMLAAITAPADENDVLHILGGTNNANAAGGITKAEYKAGMLKLWEFIQADFVNIQAIVKSPVHRILAAGSPDDAQFELIRTADTELDAENTWFFLGSERYMDDLRDNAHFSVATLRGRTEEARAKDLGYAFKADLSAGSFGPLPVSAEFISNKMRVTLTHDAGTDITVTSGCEDIFAIFVDGTAHQPSSVVRVDATKIDLIFDEGNFDPVDLETCVCVYGAMAGLSQASPEVVKDNATFAQPLRRAVLTPTNSDPLFGMTYTYDMDAVLGDKTLSGSDVTAITERSGNNFVSSAGYYCTYSSANGSLVATDDDTGYRTDTAFTGSAAHLMFMLFYAPATPATKGVIWGTGDTAGVQVMPRTSLLLDTNGDVDWFQNQTNSAQEIGSANLGGWNVVCLDFQSTSVCNAYLNSTTPVTFDPRDNMPTQTHAWFAGGNFSGDAATDGVANAEYARVWGRAGAGHGAVGDASVSDIMTYLAGLKSVTLS